MDDETEDVSTESQGDGETEVSTPDVSTYEAKIEELNGVIAEHLLTIADLNTQLTASKAANYDLMMSLPKTDSDVDSDTDSDDKGPVSIDDLFD